MPSAIVTCYFDALAKLLHGTAVTNREGRLLTFSGIRADNPLRVAGDINFYVQSRITVLSRLPICRFVTLCSTLRLAGGGNAA